MWNAAHPLRNTDTCQELRATEVSIQYNQYTMRCPHCQGDTGHVVECAALQVSEMSQSFIRYIVTKVEVALDTRERSGVLQYRRHAVLITDGIAWCAVSSMQAK